MGDHNLEPKVTWGGMTDVYVSVIVPAYNVEDYIKRCLASLSVQTCPSYEVIVVDDGSTDRTGEIAEQFCNEHDGFYYYRVIHGGAAKGRNYGITKAKGKYLSFVDADDRVEMDYLEVMRVRAEKANADLVIGGYIQMDVNGNPQSAHVPLTYQSGSDEAWAYRICSSMSRMYLRSFWEKHQLSFPDEAGAIGEDLPPSFYANVMAQNIQIAPVCTYRYTKRDQSSMQQMIKRSSFTFPYKGIQQIHELLKGQTFINSRDFYYAGLLKTFAYFHYVLYRRADKKERMRLLRYIRDVFGSELPEMRESWMRIRKGIAFTPKQRVAIQIFVWQYAERLARNK